MNSEDPPVSKAILPASPPSFTSFGMNAFKCVLKHNVGCLNSWKSTHAASPSTNSGLHAGSPIALEAFAKLNKQSSSANTLTVRSHIARSASNSANRRYLKALMAVLRFSRASLRRRIVGWRGPTSHRIAACLTSIKWWNAGGKGIYTLVEPLLVQSFGIFFWPTLVCTR